jgi:hypothetical protein
MIGSVSFLVLMRSVYLDGVRQEGSIAVNKEDLPGREQSVNPHRSVHASPHVHNGIALLDNNYVSLGFKSVTNAFLHKELFLYLDREGMPTESSGRESSHLKSRSPRPSHLEATKEYFLAAE